MRQIDIDALTRFLDYNETTGVFTWKERTREDFKTLRGFKTWSARYPGTVAGCLEKKKGRKTDYICITLLGQIHYAHRLAWAYKYKMQPPAMIDHDNGCGTDNRITNLIASSPHLNQRNKTMQVNNKSGHTGVHWSEQRQRWVAQGRVVSDGKYKVLPLGRYKTFEEAVEARERWVSSEGNFTTRHGINKIEESK